MELQGSEMIKKAKAEQRKPRTQSLKKPYIRPPLVEYGSVAKLTAGGGTTSNPDGLGFMAGMT